MDSFLSCVQSPDALSKGMIGFEGSSVFIFLAFYFFLNVSISMFILSYSLFECCLPSSSEPLIYELELFKIFLSGNFKTVSLVS